MSDSSIHRDSHKHKRLHQLITSVYHRIAFPSHPPPHHHHISSSHHLIISSHHPMNYALPPNAQRPNIIAVRTPIPFHRSTAPKQSIDQFQSFVHLNIHSQCLSVVSDHSTASTPRHHRSSAAVAASAVSVAAPHHTLCRRCILYGRNTPPHQRKRRSVRVCVCEWIAPVRPFGSGCVISCDVLSRSVDRWVCSAITPPFAPPSRPSDCPVRPFRALSFARSIA